MIKKVLDGKLEVNGDIFVIPNKARTSKEIDKLCFRNPIQAEMESILAASGTPSPFGDDIVVLQVWIVSEEDLNTENLGDNGGSFIGEDGKMHNTGYILGHIPMLLFEGHVEGDVVDLTIPKGLYEFNKDFVMVLHLKLCQKQYRYNSFGNFEDAMRYATAETIQRLASERR